MILIVINAQLIAAIILGLILPGVFIIALAYAVLIICINFVKPPLKVQIRKSDGIL